MDRRKFLIGTGSIGAATIGGLAMFGGSAAASSTSFESGGDANVSTDDGSADEVYIQPSGEVSWENFDEPVESVEVELKCKTENESQMKSVFNETFTPGSAASTGSWSYDNCGTVTLYSDGNGIGQFSSDTDGATRETDVTVEAIVTLRDGSGNAAEPTDSSEIADSATFTVYVTNEGASTNASGQANPTATGTEVKGA